ncbi:MAG: energy-coupling factor transporter transmembrane protein EcfT [Chloroflexi bacterium]|nr:energy-coupling factor transporter transmembrane protein EcfT [Chloroflexota bacterium]MCL5109335.1 energy-coupling factor transporter transmembrane protein EcfT [Chloroflexota bacterium]
MSLLVSYSFRDSFFHRLDPRTKLAWLAVMLTLCVTASQVPLLVGLALVVLASSRAARLDLGSFWPMTKATGALALVLFLVQAVFQTEGGVLFSLGPVALHARGLELAVRAALRLYVILLLSLQFTMWTQPAELSLVLVMAKLPCRYALLVGLALRFIPILERDLADIFQAQAARGMELGNALRKAIAFGPVLLPFCLRTLRRANEVALAMELRGYGFGPRRTFARTVGFGRADYTVLAGLSLLLVVYFSARANG